MSMFSNLNQVVLNEILVNLQEGNINVCRNYGFSKQELQEIEKLSTEEVYVDEVGYSIAQTYEANHAEEA